MEKPVYKFRIEMIEENFYELHVYKNDEKLGSLKMTQYEEAVKLAGMIVDGKVKV